MKILKANIEYNPQFCNPPTLQVLVDKIPDLNEMTYEYKEDLYFAEKDGYVSFFVYNAPGRGYGGRKFTITLKDGTTKELIGPWSGRCGVMNMYFEQQSMEVSITDDPKAFKRGYTFFAGVITLEKVKEAINLLQGTAILKRVGKYREVSYIVTKLGFGSTNEAFSVEYKR